MVGKVRASGARLPDQTVFTVAVVLDSRLHTKEMEAIGPALVDAVSRVLDMYLPCETLTIEQGSADAPVER